MRVALVHDWLTGFRGGERVLHELAGVFDDADLYTLIHVPGATTPRIDAMRIRASPLSRLPGAARHYRKFLPLYPWAAGRFRLRGYDLVLSSSHAFAKGVTVEDGGPHLCYCHTPMRWVWDYRDVYLGRGLRRAASAPLVSALRRWDVKTSRPDRVTKFLANGRTVADRIGRHYGRDAHVVHPPVDLDVFRPLAVPRLDAYLLVGAFVPYKREDVAVEAFRLLGRPLLVAGDGPRRVRVEAAAPANVKFLGRVSDADLVRLYSGCRALIYPQEEDLGLVPIEAQACGRPVIAFGRGGATETVVPVDAAGDGPTGLWFAEQTPESLAEAVLRFEALEGEFNPARIRAHAGQFGLPVFRDAIRAAVREFA